VFFSCVIAMFANRKMEQTIANKCRKRLMSDPLFIDGIKSY
jgi:hypothetical protein